MVNGETSMIRQAAVVVLVTSALVALPRIASAQPAEGIGVRGEWVLEVRNTDGTLAERRAFRNALTDTGKEILARMLVGAFGTDTLEINLDGSAFSYRGNPQSPARLNALGTDGQPPCPSYYFDPTRPNESNFVEFCRLSVMKSGASIILEGSVTAGRTGTIDKVGTRYPFHGGFTETMLKNATGLPQPLEVEAGQMVQVRVTISFHTGS